MRELAEVLDVHVRTIQGWHKAGLLAIDEQVRPFLFLGATVKAFLKERLQKRRKKLNPNEIYCLRCATGVVPKSGSALVEVTNRKLGHHSKLVLIRGECPRCDGTIVRFASLRSISETVWGTNAHQAGETLSDTPTPNHNTDFKRG